MHSLDLYVQNYFSLARTPLVTEWMILISRLFDISILPILILLCVVFLVYLARGKKYSFLFFITVTSGAILSYVLKLIFDIKRPTDEVVAAFGQSFPSYHALIATIFFGMLMYVFDTYFKSFWRIVFNTVCLSAVCLVAFSRVYLGVHWLSDVLGGIVLGALLAYCGVAIFKRYVL